MLLSSLIKEIQKLVITEESLFHVDTKRTVLLTAAQCCLSGLHLFLTAVIVNLLNNN